MCCRDDEFFMEQALLLAEEAAADDEAPIGALIVQDGKVIACGRNRREKGKDATLHAEMIAIREACAALGGWRLPRCTMYVTLEPCPMCAGAIVNARIDRLVFGAYDPKAGACGSVMDIPACAALNHHPQTQGGLMEQKAAALLKDFFRKKR